MMMVRVVFSFAGAVGGRVGWASVGAGAGAGMAQAVNTSVATIRIPMNTEKRLYVNISLLLVLDAYVLITVK